MLIKVRINQQFPNEISFENEQGVEITQVVQYECKPIYCKDLGGIGHTVEEFRKKKYDMALRKVNPIKVWMKKTTAPINC